MSDDDGKCSECGKGIGHFMDCSQHPDFASPEVRATFIPRYGEQER